MSLWRRTDRPPPTGNPDILRQRLDRGQGADKIDYPDPAAAPLGTDDEAAGHPITRKQLEMALRTEIRSSGGQAPAQSGRQENGRSNLRFVLTLLVCGAALIWITALLT